MKKSHGTRLKRSAGSIFAKNGPLLKKYIPHVLTILAIALAYFAFIQTSVLYTFICLIALVPIFAYFKFDGRIPFGYAAIVLLIAALSLTSYKKEVVANQFVIISYWLLVVGILCLIIDYLRNKGK